MGGGRDGRVVGVSLMPGNDVAVDRAEVGVSENVGKPIGVDWMSMV